MVQSFVIAYGGRVDVASTPGEGCTFHALLPCVAADVPTHDTGCDGDGHQHP
ncbi:hypothetical protein AB0H77_08405 [Streptomyces sp. NPDC050844]|uniref:hypothetical protein n=1 Tax=Streptomyces sp. NPDC050844 TaxID=3155790 RepID=UPI0033F8EA03